MYDVITLNWRGVHIRRFEDRECAELYFSARPLGILIWLREVPSATSRRRGLTGCFARWRATHAQPGCRHGGSVSTG
jgi:hypothetical protein